MGEKDVVAGVFDPEFDPAWSEGEKVVTDDGRPFLITRVERMRTSVRYYGVPGSR